MGQAKQRGTFEKRRAAAVERDKKAAEERYKDILIEERASRKSFKRIAPYISMATLIGHGLGGIFGNDDFWGPPKKKIT